MYHDWWAAHRVEVYVFLPVNLVLILVLSLFMFVLPRLRRKP